MVSLIISFVNILYVIEIFIEFTETKSFACVSKIIILSYKFR